MNMELFSVLLYPLHMSTVTIKQRQKHTIISHILAPDKKMLGSFLNEDVVHANLKL